MCCASSIFLWQGHSVKQGVWDVFAFISTWHTEPWETNPVWRISGQFYSLSETGFEPA